MSDKIPTVTIQGQNGPVDINESDFDPKTMKKVGAAKKKAPAKKKAAKKK